MGILFSGLLLLGILILYLIGKDYRKEELKDLDKKEYPLYQIMPIGFFLMDKVIKMDHTSKMERRTKEQLSLLYGLKASNLRLRLYLSEKIALCLMVLFCMSFLGLIIGFKQYGEAYLINGNTLTRPSYNQGTRTYELEANIKMGDEIKQTNIEVPVSEQRLSINEIETIMDQGIAYIDQHITGENTSLNYVQYPLQLVQKVPQTKLKIRWTSSAPHIMSEDGSIQYEAIPEDGEVILLTAFLSHGTYEMEYIIPVEVYPRDRDLSYFMEQELRLILQEKEQSVKDEPVVRLPEVLNEGEINIRWSEPVSHDALKFLTFGLLVSIMLFFIKDADLRKKVEERNQQLRLDFPEFLNKLTLLIGAGMTVSKAWAKVVQDYSKQKEKEKYHRYLYEEALITWHEIQGGKSELQAIEHFGKRCKLPEFMKFSSLIIQNLRKGTNTLIEALREQSDEAWNKRKEVAKILGEQASTKLLIPMMLMLLIVLVIIMVPALMTMGI